MACDASFTDDGSEAWVGEHVVEGIYVGSCQGFGGCVGYVGVGVWAVSQLGDQLVHGSEVEVGDACQCPADECGDDARLEANTVVDVGPDAVDFPHPGFDEGVCLYIRNGVREQELWESRDNASDIEGGVPESGPFVVEELRALGIDDVVG